jgi:hypothetical protein
MLQPISQAEQALRDTLITHAEGDYFDDLTALYGFEKPFSIQREVWRHALRLVAFGYRGTLGTTWGAFELGFRLAPEDRTWQGTIDPANPHTFTRTPGGGPSALDGFTCEWIGRYVRLRYSVDNLKGGLEYTTKILYVEGPPYIPDAGPFPPTLFFANVPTGLWEVEDCSNPLITGPVTATLELLPHIFREPSPGPPTNPAQASITPVGTNNTPEVFIPTLGTACTVEILLDASIFVIPATYLIAENVVPYPAGQAELTPPGQPYGGAIMDMFAAVNGDMTPNTTLPDVPPPPDPEGYGDPILEAGDPLGIGPYPIYFIDELALSGFELYFDPILAAGVHLKTIPRSLCLFEGSFSGVLLFDDFTPQALGGVDFDTLWEMNVIPGAAAGHENTVEVRQSSTELTKWVAVLRGGLSNHPNIDTEYRVLQTKNTVEGPVKLKYEYVQGALEDGISGPGLDMGDPDVLGGANEHLEVEYSLDGIAWVPVVLHSADNTITPPGVYLQNEETINVPNPLYIRFVQKASNYTTDNWGINSVVIESL